MTGAPYLNNSNDKDADAKGSRDSCFGGRFFTATLTQLLAKIERRIFIMFSPAHSSFLEQHYSRLESNSNQETGYLRELVMLL